ncbi:hypothetical protein TWF192_001254 [Orbilia oligospora]|nr:hypothetical protein TWF192_001254 [Orbilia oligospora]
MTRTSFLVHTVISALCFNGAVYAMDSEADWAFAANNLAKRAIAVPSPTQKGQPTNCIAWKNVEAAEADSGDCDLILSKYKNIKLTEEIFLSLNPALKGDCANLQKNFYVCVQVGASTGAAKTTAAAESKTTAVKAATTPKTPAKAEEEEEEEEEDDRHADNPPAVKLTTKNPAPPTKLEAEEKDQFIITGAGDTTLSPRFCAPRRNLVNLQKELPDTFNLLVLALDKMMKTPDSNALSYFQLSDGRLKATSRRPEDSSSSVSFDAAADNAMQSGYNTRRKQTYNALTSATTFNFFSNALEKLHNDVHMQVGGNGIMGLISYAAFDPIFWLHHNNIDRLLAIWQAANPGKYLTPDTATSSFKRKVQKTDQDDLDTPLYPWKHPDGEWWTSHDVKDVTNIWKYGYGYPEVPCYYQGDTNTLDDHATEAINRAYGDIGVPRIKGRAAVKSASIAGRNVTEWDINIIVDQAELPGTFSIYVFLGNPPADPKKWDMSSQKVSTMTLLGNPEVAKMSKLEGMTIPLGPLLAQKGVKGTEKEIQDYLAKYLVWTCMSLGEEGGTKPYDVKLMKSLKVVVTSRNVFIPSDMKVKPKVSKAKIQTAATKNQAKSGGASTLAELANTKLKGGATAHLRIGILPDIQNTTVTGKSYR